MEKLIRTSSLKLFEKSVSMEGSKKYKSLDQK